VEGVRLNPAVPLPTYAACPEFAVAVLPDFERRVLAEEARRVLVCGAPRPDLIKRLAEAGRWVAVCDVDEVESARIDAAVGLQLRTQVNITARPYPDVSYQSSSFDAVVFLDALHRYTEPEWVLRKVQRECKVDGVVALRTPVRGPVTMACTATETSGTSRTGAFVHFVRKRLEQAEGFADERVTGELKRVIRAFAPWPPNTPEAAEAFERGAHLSLDRFAIGGDAVCRWMQELFRIDRAEVGSSARMWFCEAAAGLQPRVASLCARALEFVPGDLPRVAPASEEVFALGLFGRKTLGLGRTFSI